MEALTVSMHKVFLYVSLIRDPSIDRSVDAIFKVIGQKLTYALVEYHIIHPLARSGFCTIILLSISLIVQPPHSNPTIDRTYARDLLSIQFTEPPRDNRTPQYLFLD